MRKVAAVSVVALIAFSQIVLALLAFYLVFALLRIARELGAPPSVLLRRRQKSYVSQSRTPTDTQGRWF
jgi:hypothetical protein